MSRKYILRFLLHWDAPGKVKISFKFADYLLVELEKSNREV
jgi:hypothetical protein